MPWSIIDRVTHSIERNVANERGESAAERRRFAGWVTASFLVLTLPRLLLHELWRDEAWLWLVVTDSSSLADLAAPLARSGQGWLFPLLCYWAGQVSDSPAAMQLVHLALAGGAAYVFVRWAPLGRLERALVVLGYFPFYEYAVISRHYAAGALLLWLACAAVGGRRPALGLGVAVALLCQTTVYGVILACALGGSWWLERGLQPRRAAQRRRWEAAAGLALGLTGLLVGISQLRPSPGTRFAPEWSFGWDASQAGEVARVPWRALAPVPRPEVQFWNSNLLVDWPGFEAAAGPAMLVLALALLWPHRLALVTFGLGALGLLVFGYVKYLGVGRHHGHLWLLLLAALWLAGGKLPGWKTGVFRALLVLHCAAGAFASCVDLRHPFSNGPAMAELIRREGLDRLPLFGHREPPAAAVALPLGRPLYSPSRGVFTTHPDWGPNQGELNGHEVRCAARALVGREGRDILLVMNWEVPPWPELTRVGARRGAIVASEDFHLYLLELNRLTATAPAARCPGE